MSAVRTEETPEYKVDRRHFLGGSEAAAVMGLSPWKTPVELWQLKTGKVEPEAPDPVRLKILERGRKLEPFIRDMAIDKLRDMGLQVELLACNAYHVDPEHDFMRCEIDFELRVSGPITIGDKLYVLDDEVINADAKSVGTFARKKWGETDSEDVPIEYAAQFMYGLMITGRRFCLVAALRSFDDVEIFWTVRDDETIAGMRPKMVEFWLDHVLADVPPDPLKFSDIKALFPLDNGQAVEATNEIAVKVAELRGIRAEIKRLEERGEALSLDIAEFISPNARLTFCGKDIATWKAQQQSRIDQSRLLDEAPEIAKQFTITSTIRVLRLTKPKGSA